MPDVSIGSAAFLNVYLRMDGSGVTAFSRGGGGRVNCQYGVGPWERFQIQQQPNGTVAIASVAFPGVFLRMDGSGVTGFSRGGGGTVNCQHGVGPWEQFQIQQQPNGTVAIASAAFPGVFLRMDGSSVTGFSRGGGGTINCQHGVGPWEQFRLVEIPPGNWTPLTNQPSFTANTMMLLTDGTVMVQELDTANWHRLTPDASGSYINGSWSALRAGPNAPKYYASAVLNDGRVIIAGGEFNNGNHADLDAAEIYDPVANSWTTITTPGWGWIGDAPACVLPDGRLLMGSINDTRTAIYDPTTNGWTAGPTKDDASSEETWTLLPDGTTLTAEVNNHPKVEKYVQAADTGTGTDAWVSAGSVPAGHDLVQQTTASTEIGPAVLMTDGRVFAIGATGHTALYTPPANPADTGTWTAGPDFPADAAGNPWRAFDAPAVLLPNGRVLCIVGPAEASGWAGQPCHAFEFDGTTLLQVADPPNASQSDTWECRLLLLPTGEVLCSACSTNIQVYQPGGGPKSGWAPVIVSAPTSVIPGGRYPLQGQQLNGLSQANSYGDDAQMATNFPIVQIQSAGQVFYCRTHGFSTMSVATGTAVVAAQFDVPTGVRPGSAQLCVIANGIATCSPIKVRGWRANDLTAIAGGQPAAGPPFGYLTGFAGQGSAARVVYRDADGHIWELNYPGPPSQWGVNDLTARAGGNPAAGPPFGYLTGFAGQGPRARVVYRDADGHIWELNYPGPSGQWGANDLTAIAGGPPAAGPPFGYVTDFARQGPRARVIYQGTDGHIWELNYPGPSGQWGANDLTAIAGGPPAAGPPFGYVADIPGQPGGAGLRARVIYQSTDGHIWELNYPGPSGQWGANDLTVRAHGERAAGPPHCYLTYFTGQWPTPRVIYQGTDGHIWELNYSVQVGGWGANDLTAIAGGPPAAGPPFGYVTDFPNQGPTARVIYQGTDGHIWELNYPGTGWGVNDLTASAGGNPAAGQPFGYLTDFAGQGPTARVIYQGTDGHIWELNYG